MSVDFSKSNFIISITGKKPIEKTDQKLWNTFSTEFNTPLTRLNIEEAYIAINEQFPDFCSNNLKTNNFMTIISKFINFLKESSGEKFDKKINSKNSLLITNILFIARVLLHIIIQDCFPSAKISCFKQEKFEKKNKKKKNLFRKERKSLDKNVQKNKKKDQVEQQLTDTDDSSEKSKTQDQDVNDLSNSIDKIKKHLQIETEQKNLKNLFNSIFDFIIMNPQTLDHPTYVVINEMISFLLVLFSITFFDTKKLLLKDQNKKKDILADSDTLPDDWVEDSKSDFGKNSLTESISLDTQNPFLNISNEKAKKLVKILLNHIILQMPTPKSVDPVWGTQLRKGSFFSRSLSKKTAQKLVVDPSPLATQSILLLIALFQINDFTESDQILNSGNQMIKETKEQEIQLNSKITFQNQIQIQYGFDEYDNEKEKEDDNMEQNSETELLERNYFTPSNIYLKTITQLTAKKFQSENENEKEKENENSTEKENQNKENEKENEKQKENENTIGINFSELLFCLASSERVNEHYLVLFYYMIYNNWDFITFVSKNANLTSYLTNLLEELYQYRLSEEELQKEKVPFIYLILIVLLVLSGRRRFRKFIFSSNLQSVNWYKDKQLSNISLGHLTVIILMETLHYHLLKFPKKEIFLLSLSILNNLSSLFTNLFANETKKLLEIVSFVSQKVKDFSNFDDPTSKEETISNEMKKKKTRNKKDKKKKKTDKKSKIRKSESICEVENQVIEEMIEKIGMEFSYTNDYIDIESLKPSPSLLTRPDRLVRKDNRNAFVKFQNEKTAELHLYSDYLLILFSLINTTLTNQFNNNTQLIYTLLKHRRLFSPFSAHPVLWKYVSNFHKLDKFFDIDFLERKNTPYEEILQNIQNSVPNFVFQEKGFFIIENKLFKFQEFKPKNNIFSTFSWLIINKNLTLRWDLDFIHIL